MNDEIRTRVVAAADALFYTRGSVGSALTLCANAAGVSQRVLYRGIPVEGRKSHRGPRLPPRDVDERASTGGRRPPL
ncbi:hypothetical protein [Rhodococcus zopfii]|uniref:hypothetical protein n=1 Tax=Rhodococcus zopfii TaxID=43772 RepID=UPI001EDE34AD|nr:hypothetical protein [Rhodococcus zopfii]